MRSILILLAVTALLTPATAVTAESGENTSTYALPCGCDFSGLPGAVWWGSRQDMTAAEVAAYAAPVFWFSPDEPSLRDLHGVDVMIPEAFPFQEAAGPVVYYQIKEVVRPGSADASIYREAGADRGSAVLTVGNGAAVVLEYYAYYADESGFSSHRHDVEGAELRIGIARTDGEYLSHEYPELDFALCGEPHLVMLVTQVTGKAHGIDWYWNVLEVESDARFPMNLLVEEGKHASAPDKNGDGYFTPSYDVNVRVNDAWGVRDIIRSGGLFSAGYQAWMTKVRHPEDRVLPPLPADSPLVPNLAAQQREYTEGNAVYELRPLPAAAEAAAWDATQGPDSHLEGFLTGKEMPDGPKYREVSDLDDIRSWISAGTFKKSLSIAAYADGRFGFSWTFPFFIGRNMAVPMTGGYLMHRMYLKGHHLSDFGWTLLYANSASRWFDPYLAAGAEWYDVTEAGVTSERVDFVMDAGFKFRTQIGQTPLRFLSFLTEFWGLRIGIKNYGFFDIDRFTYVIELGAGSF